MHQNQVKAYVDVEVQKISDARIKPLVAAINEEIGGQDRNNQRIAELKKQNTESDDRIKKLQEQVGEAQVAVNKLATKLAESTVPAVTTGQE